MTFELNKDYTVAVPGYGVQTIRFYSIAVENTDGKIAIDGRNKNIKTKMYFIKGKKPKIWDRIKFLFKPIPVVSIGE